VPKVLSWSGQAENPLESEYILMEEATGNQLGEIWDEMEIHDKLKIVDDILDLEKKFSTLSFTRSVLPDWCNLSGSMNGNPQLWKSLLLG
jgi:hypothetical protein